MPTIRFRPIQSARLFNAKRRYDQINWTSFSIVVREFNKQLRGWYIAPAKVAMKSTGHFSFAALSLTCTLIDTLSQYYYGSSQSSQKVFVRFCRTQFPALRRPVNPAIAYVRRVGKKKQIRKLNDVAEVLYAGIRCGIVHEAHSSLFTAISGTGKIATICRKGLTEFSQNGGAFRPCPTVVFDPGPLLTAVTQWLPGYFKTIQGTTPTNLKLRRRFARKFHDSYGVVV